MTQEDKRTYLDIAFRSVGLRFTSEQLELVILTTETFRTKKEKFSIRDSAKILATAKANCEPESTPEFEDLESLEGE